MSRTSLAGDGLRYLIVGGYNTLFTLAVFWVLDRLWGAALGVQPVYWISAVVGILNGFLTQRIFVWRVRGAWRRELAKFAVVNLVVAVLNSLLLFVTVTLLGLPTFPTQVAITSVLIILAFFANRHWVFARAASDTEDGQPSP
ncbi:GtrA family protein [Microbacterium paulum]